MRRKCWNNTTGSTGRFLAFFSSQKTALCAAVRMWPTFGAGPAHQSYNVNQRPRKEVGLIIGRITSRVCDYQDDITILIYDSPM